MCQTRSEIEFLKRVRGFSIAAHGPQVRKYTNEPYWHHPRAVAEIVASAGGSVHQIAAAWLHDVVEDTDIDLTTIQREFGEGVSNLVFWLTDVSRPEDGNRARRKALDREHIAIAPPEAKTVKLADLIDNTSSIVEHDPKFAQVYLAEKEQLLPLLVDGDMQLWKRARKALIVGRHRLWLRRIEHSRDS